MKNIFLSRKAKIWVDIVLILGFFLLTTMHGTDEFAGTYWISPHCIAGLLWLLIMALHVWQHWKLIGAFVKKKVILKNKMTALTIFFFILMLASILFFMVGFEIPFLKFHNVIGHFFVLVMIIHTISKWKRLVSLLRG